MVKLGTRVWSLGEGWGAVINICPNGEVEVWWDNGVIGRHPEEHLITVEVICAHN